jgi:hypothetical protein
VIRLVPSSGRSSKAGVTMGVEAWTMLRWAEGRGLAKRLWRVKGGSNPGRPIRLVEMGEDALHVERQGEEGDDHLRNRRH